MIHASTFFESILTGEWAETTELCITSSSNSSSSSSSRSGSGSSSSNQNLQQPPEQLEPEQQHIINSSSSHHPPTNDQLDSVLTTNDDPSSPTLNLPPSNQLDSDMSLSQPLIHPPIFLRPSIPHIPKPNRIEARILLKEERPASFQDLLMFVYPHLECVCTWHNASDLMTMSQKFDMPLLKRHVMNFLLSSVAGKPIEAMKIAEEHQLSELYRESSRFLLDNWQGWDHNELQRLSSSTLLKLEKRRTWFLERLLKLGLVNSSRDYVCPPTCPDPHHCTKLVDDKWRSAWAASFKFGPPQPSSVYRALRCLEPSLHSPALLLPHTSCQQHALRFFADLFDRMFSQFTPRGPGVVGVSTSGMGSVGNMTISHSASASSTMAAGAVGNPVVPPLVEGHQQLSGVPFHPNTSGTNPIVPPPLPPQLPPNSTTSSTTTTNIGTTNPNTNNSINLNSTVNNLSNNHTTLSAFSTLNLATSSASNLLINSDKNFRKAKYFLHVELFDSVEKNQRKRID